jgi:predicted TIM-barrel fold metal-dependent hydrolase
MPSQPIIDVDCHHTWARNSDLVPYMPKEWHDYFAVTEPELPSHGRMCGPLTKYPAPDGLSIRPETWPDAGMPGSSYELMCEQHLDPNKISRVLLTWGFGLNPGMYNANASVVMCRAANDFMLDYWFGQNDDRLYGSLYVPVAAPTEAAKEIHRLASHPRVSAVIAATNPFHKAAGHPVYHPIYEAAVEHDLPVILHLGSDLDTFGSWQAAGLPTTKAEYAGINQPAHHHLASLISEGVFEKFPTIRFLFNEYGSSWIPWILWELDSRIDLLRRENPTLQRLPSEYFREHVWVDTQPLLGEGDSVAMIELLESFGGMDDRLCYAGDYPHWDFEWPQHVAPRLPRPWRPKVMAENAARLFGWSMDEVRAVSAVHGRERAAA